MSGPRPVKGDPVEENQAQRPMTWDALCDELVKQRRRAEQAEKQIDILVKAARIHDENCTTCRAEFQERLAHKS